MRIIQLIQKPQARGAEIFTSQLCTGLLNVGHQVLLISLFKGDYKLPFLGEQIHLQLSPKKRLWDYASWKKIGKIIEDFNPEIVQANGADTLKFAVFARIIKPGGYQLIFNNGGVVSYYVNSFLKKKFNQFLFGKVDALISVSNYSKSDLNHFISKPKPHRVLPVGVEFKILPKVQNETGFQVIVHIGGFTHEKDHLAVLGIFEKFHFKRPDSQLWLIGDGPLKNQIEKIVFESSYLEKVRFFGAISNPFSIIPSNSLLILPSKIEGLPAVILEAFYHQIPVFANDVGGISELIKNEETGMLIPYGNTSLFTDELLDYLALSANQKQIMLKKAKDLVLKKYSIQEVFIQYQSYYEYLCESSNS